MRIGICGAQSTGKTTLLNALRSEDLLKDYIICNEVTRKVKSYGLPINEQGNNVTQKLIMQEHIVNVFLYNKMITDRTSLDGYVYSTHLHNHRKIDDECWDFVKKIHNKVWSNYDIVFYLDPEFEIEDDGVRSIDRVFRDSIVNLFKYTIEKNKLNVIKLTGSLRERVESALKIIKEKS